MLGIIKAPKFCPFVEEQRKHTLQMLFEDWAQEPVVTMTPLPRSASYREYVRISGAHHSALGAWNHHRKENVAFLEFSKHFYQQGLPVPEIYAEALDEDLYLIQDLGDTTLFSFLTDRRRQNEFPDEVLEMYKTVLDELPRFQILARQNLNYGVCYPRAAFDQQSMLWDLNYFKYNFLKLIKVPFDEQALEDDFQTFITYLLQADCNFFLHRDCQSRNIMIVQERPYFIDYQGGRRGALHYDLASLLYDAKADLPPSIRQELREHYIQAASRYAPINEQEFLTYYDGYVLIRLMQAMGAYGFRGLYEKNHHLLHSIPYAVKNLAAFLESLRLPISVPELLHVLHGVVESEAIALLRREGRVM